MNPKAFEKEKAQLTSVDQMRGVNMPNFEAMEQTRMLAHTLDQNNDPKFQLENQHIAFGFQALGVSHHSRDM
ncbi:hypothetical protein Ddye_027744 [Dipteronia dyeriana]|uniref:Uncharacterized protein n=1 Tax=Dipteronia dyeriana TaxID=168575 RepID=A0AAD9TQN3_9ROSI|nr:hypothetical protein Ddye_027744 [Dipteronia dyeriana]